MTDSTPIFIISFYAFNVLIVLISYTMKTLKAIKSTIGID